MATLVEDPLLHSPGQHDAVPSSSTQSDQPPTTVDLSPAQPLPLSGGAGSSSNNVPSPTFLQPIATGSPRNVAIPRLELDHPRLLSPLSNRSCGALTSNSTSSLMNFLAPDSFNHRESNFSGCSGLLTPTFGLSPSQSADDTGDGSKTPTTLYASASKVLRQKIDQKMNELRTAPRSSHRLLLSCRSPKAISSRIASSRSLFPSSSLMSPNSTVGLTTSMPGSPPLRDVAVPTVFSMDTEDLLTTCPSLPTSFSLTIPMDSPKSPTTAEEPDHLTSSASLPALRSRFHTQSPSNLSRMGRRVVDDDHQEEVDGVGDRGPELGVPSHHRGAL